MSRADNGGGQGGSGTRGYAGPIIAVVLALCLAGVPALAVGAVAVDGPTASAADDVQRAGSADEHQRVGSTNALQTAGPTANLTVSPNPAHPGEPVVLDATESTAEPNESIVRCDFDTDGDGTYETSTQTCQFERTYDTIGEYTVGVRVVSSTDETDTENTTLTVRENTWPVPRISVSPDNAQVGEVVTLSGADSTDSDGQVVSYEWTVDGRSLTGETVEFEVSDAGTYEVTLDVVDDDGASNATSTTVEVVANQPPSADLFVAPTSATVGETVTLDASGSSDPDGTVVAYRWDVDGDGTTDRRTDVAEITMTVQSAGDRAVSVTVVDDRNATDTATADLAVATAVPTTAATTTSGADQPSQPDGGTQGDLLDALDPGLVPVVPDWLVLLLLGVAVGVAVAHRREPIPSRVGQWRERMYTGEFRRNVAKKGVGFVAKSAFKKLFRKLADIVDGTGDVVGGFFEWVGRTIKRVTDRVAEFLRRIGS